MAFLLIIGLSFYVVAVSTINLVGDSLFADTIRQQMSSVSQLAVTLGERLNRETAEAFHQRLMQAARQIGGRLLVVDTDGKVIYDTFDERCGTLLALGEVHTVLRGEKDGDYGFHLQDGAGVQQTPSVFDRITGRDVSRVWVGCFTAPLEDAGEAQGVLIQLSSVSSAVTQVAKLILTEHLTHCVLPDCDEDTLASLEEAIDQFAKLK